LKILLIEPAENPYVLGLNKFICVEPLALEVVAANLLPDGHAVRILDMRIDRDLSKALAEFEPDIVGVTGYTPDLPEMRRICRIVKELSPKTMTVVGGHHASMNPADFNAPEVDAIAPGDGEVTFPNLVRALVRGEDVRGVPGLILRENGRLYPTPKIELLSSLEHTPLPARDLVQHYRSNYFFWFWDPPYPLETVRGCPFRCNFCSVWAFNQGTSRFRSVDSVLKEIESLPADAKSVFFADDHFLQHIPRALKMAQQFQAAGVKLRVSFQTRSDSVARHPDVVEAWAKAGLFTAFIGFEAFRQQDLDALHKSNSVRVNEEAARILRDNGVHIWGAFIVDPTWDVTDFDALIDYVRGLRIGFPQFTVLTPLPGTEIFFGLRDKLVETKHHLFDLAHSVLPTKLPREEFYRQMARLYASTTLSLSEVKRMIRTGVFPIDALRRARHVLSAMTNPEAYLAGHSANGAAPNMSLADISDLYAQAESEQAALIRIEEMATA